MDEELQLIETLCKQYGIEDDETLVEEGDYALEVHDLQSLCSPMQSFIEDVFIFFSFFAFNYVVEYSTDGLQSQAII